MLVSSDPVNMMVKEENVVIPPGTTGKLQLRFPPVKAGGRKMYWLSVSNRGEPWECFKFVVNYQ